MVRVGQMMSRSNMSPRDFFVVEKTKTKKKIPREGLAAEHLTRRTSSVKPVNVAGCRDRSSSSTRRLKRVTPRENENTFPERSAPTPDVSGKIPHTAARSEIASSYNALNVVTPVSVATRIRRKLKEIKRVPFFNCVSSNLNRPEGKGCIIINCKSEKSAAAEPNRPRQRKRSSLSNTNTNAQNESFDTHPSIRIRALFPEAAESRKKILLADSLSKLRRSVLFRSRSPTPSKTPRTVADIPERCGE